MAKRFYEVEITREVYATVTIMVDDDENPVLKEDLRKVHSVLSKHVGKAADKIDPYEWETDRLNTSINSYEEIDEAEAVLYSVWDAQKNEVYKPE